MGDIEMELAKKEFGRWFVSKRDKLENAARHYLNAANKYKTVKEYHKSADAFIKHATALEELEGSLHQICDSYKRAGVQLKLAKDPKCMEMYDKAVNVLCDQGKHSQAAKMCQEMGELAAKAKEWDEALMHYQKAVDLFLSDDYKVQARRCLEKVAELHVYKTPPEFSEAAEVFEKVAKQAMENRLSRSSARKHFFRSAICIIAAGDAVLAHEKGNQFLRLDPSFGSGREGKLMQQLIQALEEYNVKNFVMAVTNYNEISEFDEWHVKVLVAGRAHIDPDMETQPKSHAGASSPKAAPEPKTTPKKKVSLDDPPSLPPLTSVSAGGHAAQPVIPIEPKLHDVSPKAPLEPKLHDVSPDPVEDFFG